MWRSNVACLVVRGCGWPTIVYWCLPAPTGSVPFLESTNLNVCECVVYQVCFGFPAVALVIFLQTFCCGI